MKKHILTKASLTAGILGLILASNSASANMSNCQLYVGAGADYNYYDFGLYPTGVIAIEPNSELKSNGIGLLPIAGLKFHRHFGVEAGYSFNKKIKVILNDHTPQREFAAYKVKNMYMDFMGFVPIRHNVQILGGIGIGNLNVKPDLNGAYGVTEVHNKFNWRAKVGVNYNINKRFGIRAVATYQEVGNRVREAKFVDDFTESATRGTKLIRDLTSVGIALTYNF